MLGLTSGNEASFEVDKRLSFKKLCKLLIHKVDGLVHHIAHMVKNIVKRYVCETVITASSELDIGRSKFKYCS